MRLAALAWSIVLLGARVASAGEVPEPLFWESADDFHHQVGSGQFIDRIELHLVQYSADAEWRLDWAAAQHAGNGLLGEYGSTTGTDLLVTSRIALNGYPTARSQIRYDRRDWQDGRFQVADQRFDAVWYAGAGWGLVVSGWPTFQKEYASFGAGLRLGAPRARNSLDVRLMNDRWVWNAKNDQDSRFTRRPLRLVADGHAEVGGWRVRGSLDWGFRYAAEELGGGGAPGRTTEGLQRFVDLEARHAWDGWAAGLRLTWIALERSQVEATGTRLALDRRWGRALVSLRSELGRFWVSGLAGWASQRDDFPTSEAPSAAYAADSLLVGAEGTWRATGGLELGLGYLGSTVSADRDAPPGSPLEARSERGYVDKAHVRAVYTFQPGQAVEFLLSQALQGGRFGGGSIKAVFVF